MQQIDYETIAKALNSLPHDEHDVELYEQYQNLWKNTQSDIDDKFTLSILPIYEGTEGTESFPHLTRYGFMKLSLDKEYMRSFYIPFCKSLMNNDIENRELSSDSLRHIRLSLIEFSLLAHIEAQEALTYLNVVFGPDDELIEPVVDSRWPNFQSLQRFLNAHEGSGIGVNPDDIVSSYTTALSEVKHGGKATGWIWYIFPQMAGIPGVHSRPAIKYGIMGRMEAIQYINHPILRRHLVEITQAVLDSSHTVYEIFGPDTIKVRSCMKLFASVCDEPVFKKVIERYRWN